MKKVISILLCVFLMLGAVSSVAFAEDSDYVDARDLREYGQRHFYLGDPTTVAPIMDGIVIPGEYTLSFETTIDDEYGLRDGHPTDIIGDHELQVSKITYYWSYDEEHIYMAAEVVDEEAVPYAYFYGNPEGSTNKLRGDNFYFSLCGVKDTGAPETTSARLDFGIFPWNEEYAAENPDDPQTAVWVELRDDAYRSVKTNTPLEFDAYTSGHAVGRNEATKVTTYEITFVRESFQQLFPEYQDNGGKIRDDVLALSYFFQDTYSEILSVEDGGSGKEAGKKIYYWGVTGEQADAAYSALYDYWFSDAGYRIPNTADKKIIHHMLFLGHEEDFVELLTTEPEWDFEEDEDLSGGDDDDLADDYLNNSKYDDDDTSSDSTTGDADKTDKTDVSAKGGCGASVSLAGLALVATFGLGITVLKRK